MQEVSSREGTMSSLASKDKKLKFLLDENVKKELLPFLKKDFDVIFKPKRLSNGELAELSKSEQRIFVTNDWDFTDKFSYNKETIFSIVWLRIPQDKPESLLREFSKLIDENSSENFEGKFITLYEDRFTVEPLSPT
jgi:predicted nuclease of predicted toxin-antitoxin system